MVYSTSNSLLQSLQCAIGASVIYIDSFNLLLGSTKLIAGFNKWLTIGILWVLKTVIH